MVWFHLAHPTWSGGIPNSNVYVSCMCPLRWTGGQKQQASHNRLAISCHLATMQTVPELVPPFNTAKQQRDDDEQVPKNSSQDVQQQSKQMYHQFISIYIYIYIYT
jgi:hypothetical protein